MKNIASMLATLNKKAENIGEISITTEWIELFIPLTFVSLSWGTNWGKIAPMAGVCMPEPNDLMAETTNKSQIKSYPKRNKMAKTRVEKAIKELAAVLAKQDAQRTANETLREMDIKSIGLAEKIKEGIDKILV